MLEDVTLSRTFGEEAGRFFQSRLEEHGIEIHGGDSLARFEGADGRVTKVVTEAGLELDADAVVIGAGVIPDVTLARNAGLELGDSGGVVASSRLETSVPGIYVAGDIAQYDSPVHRRSIRVEHWDVAFNQGKTAALNMLGRDVPHDVVPYFFSDLADWGGLEYVGPAFEWDEEIVRGSFEEGAFTVWYLKDSSVKAALAVGRSDDLDHARRLLSDDARLQGPERDTLADVGADLAELRPAG
jgi:3-phenylpropionate/trans-cinnamate dioxygenase ferredoxin reductase subunit